MQYRPHHTAISVRNLDKSLAFYQALGYEQVHRYDEADGSMVIVHLKLGGSFLEIFAYKQNAEAQPASYRYANNLEDIGVKHIALATDNIHTALQDMRAKGLADENTTITAGSTNVRYFFIKDPDGVWVELIQESRYA